MKKTIFVKSLLLASILPFCSFMATDNGDNTPKEEQQIILTNDIDNGVDNETLQVPVTATLSNNLLNVHFTGNIPMATVSVQNALTGATVNRQALKGIQGMTFSVPVSGMTLGTITVTNEQSGESVSGDFEVEAEE